VATFVRSLAGAGHGSWAYGDGREANATSAATYKWKRQLSRWRESLIGPVRTPDQHRGCRV
jgi:hypothetical protein